LAFSVRTAHLGGDAYLTSVSGEADMYTSPRVEQEIARILELGGTRVVVDLLNSPFIDSTLLGVLIEARRRLLERGGDVVVVSDDRRIVRTFELTGLDRVFAIHASLADATASVLSGEAGGP